MQFDLPNQFSLDKISDTNGILADDKHSTGTALTGVSAATFVGGVKGDDKEDDSKEKENGAENKKGNGEKDDDKDKDKSIEDYKDAMEDDNDEEINDDNDKDKSTEDDKADMEDDNKEEEPPDNLSMKSGDAAADGITTPKGKKRPAAISPRKNTILAKKKTTLINQKHPVH